MPNAIAIIGLALAALVQYNTALRNSERVDARLDFIEQDRVIKATANDKRVGTVESAIIALTAQGNKTEYRVTVAETNLTQMSARQDHFADAIGDLRDGMGKINTSLEVLTQKIDNAFPKKM